jgi:CheY-like chemotaxis protein
MRSQEELIATARSLLRLLDAEQKLRDTAEELRQANQRTHEFLAMLAHELRNPLSRSRGGLGIGLTVVKSLVEMHGGQVRAWSEGEGKGCEVEVLLPVLSSDAVIVAEKLPRTTQARLSPTRRRVLVVEDNIDAQRTLRSLLELWGHEVTVASDGNEGIDAIKTQQPEIALVDIGLPVTDGYELARRLQCSASRQNVLLVALTGYGSPEQRARALEAGFDLHLVKPVEPDQLAALISAGRDGMRRTELLHGG